MANNSPHAHIVKPALFVLIAGLFGCEAPPPQSLVAGSPSAAPREGAVAVEGPIETNKALFVGPYLIMASDIEEELGPDWRKITNGRRVRVEGVTEIYVCGPQEQCLIEGRIPRFKRVDNIQVLP